MRARAPRTVRVKLKLNLHETKNGGPDIDLALQATIDDAAAKTAPHTPHLPDNTRTAATAARYATGFRP